MLFKPISLTILLFCIVTIFIAGCKSQKIESNEYSLLIEIKKEITLTEIKSLEDLTILESRRSNRTLNQWVIQVSSTISEEEILKDLAADEMVIDVQLINQKPNSITTSTNEKKGKGKPSRND